MTGRILAAVSFVAASITAVLVTVALAAGSGAQDDEGLGSRDDPLQLLQVRRMVELSHRFLLSHQNADGSFDIVRSQASRSAPIAVTSLAALSFMAAGHAPDAERGRYGRSLTRAVDWLIDRCDDKGYFYAERDEVSRMHGQGYAVLALTQAYGMYASDPGQQKRLHDAIARGVALIESAQGHVGGWYYEPRIMDLHEGSITVCMIQSLRAARDAGFQVDSAVIERAQTYLWRSQNPATGKFRYAINDDKETWALTAAALSTLNALGDYGGDRMDMGFDALQRDDPYLNERGWENFLQYGSLYAAQTFWHHRERSVFKRWWGAFLNESIRLQGDDGAFRNGEYGFVYGTAIVSLTLQVPLGYLPIFQR